MFQRYLYGGSVLYIAQKITKNHHHSRKYEGTFYWNICFLAFSYFHFDINFLLLAKYFKGCKPQTGKNIEGWTSAWKWQILTPSDWTFQLIAFIFSPIPQSPVAVIIRSKTPERKFFCVYSVEKCWAKGDYVQSHCSLSFVFQNRFQVIAPSMPVVLN